MASKEMTTDQTSKMALPLAPLIAAWLVPSGGHFWLRRWGRGTILLASVGLMFVLGLVMQGRFFGLDPSNIVETLGFMGDFCSGLLYIAARLGGYQSLPSASPASDYGTKFLLVAGLLNVLCILDAYDIAIGKKD